MALPGNGKKESGAALPLSIIENFFTCHNLRESKQMLREIREQLINKSYPHNSQSIQHDNVIYFFEKIEDLIDAAHLLNGTEGYYQYIYRS